MKGIGKRASVVRIIAVCAGTWAAGVVRAAPGPAGIEEAVAAAARFDYGQSRKALWALERLINETHGRAQLRAEIEQQLVRQLEGSASPAAKQFFCRKLWMIGTGASVPALARLLIGADAHAAEIACYALNRHPSPAAGAALRGALGKGKGQALLAVVNLLGDRRDAQAVEPLAALASGTDAAAADAAIAALGKIATPRALELLARLLRGADAAGRAAAAHASLQAAQELTRRGQRDRAKAVYGQLARSDLPLPIRRGALLGRIGLGGEDAASLVLAALRGKDEALKAAAIASVRTMPGGNVARAFAAVLPELPARQQRLLLGALADRGDRSALPAVTRAAAHGDPAVRIEAIKALGSIGDASSVPVLVKAWAAGGAERQAAAISLRMLRADGAEAAILEGMKSARGDLRIELIGVLTDRRSAGAVPALLPEAASADAAVCKAAFRALAVLAGPEHLPALVRLLVALKVEEARLDAERAAARVARKAADPAASADVVLGAVRAAKGPGVQCSLLRVLGGIATDRSYQALLDAANDPNAEVQHTAIRALSEWPDARAADALLKTVRRTTNDAHRILALRGFVRLARTARAAPARLVRQYAEAMAAARRADERKLILSGLAGVHHADALAVVLPCLEDRSVRAEAAVAAISIAGSLGDRDAAAANAAMTKVVAVVQDDALRARARGLIRQPPPPLPQVYLDTLKPVKARSGNRGGKGPPQINRNCVGGPLRLRGMTYQRGVGEHANADLTYTLKPEYGRFVCTVGLDDQVGRHGDVRGSIVVKVFLDQTLVVQTPVLRGAGASWNLDVEIPSGGRTLRLVVEDAGDGVGYDDADFVNAGFVVRTPTGP